MARIRETDPLLPSVLDRLITEDIHAQRDPPKNRAQVLRELKQSVRRDLENLLNTRWRCRAWPPDLDELDQSLTNYGIPDFAGANMGSAANREELRAIVERVIRTFEPRFRSVRVELLDLADRDDRMLRFRIDALLHAEPAPEPVVFDSQLEIHSANFEVTQE